MLLTAAVLTFLLGLMHSYLGERRIIGKLLKMSGLPTIFGSEEYTKHILRVAWHVTSLLWWGLASVLCYLHFSSELTKEVFLYMVAVVFSISGIFPLVLTKGKHRSWIFFFAVAAITGYVASQG